MDLSFAYKAYCDKAKAVFLCLMQKKKSLIRLNLRLLAEMVGFEPTCPIKDKTISSATSYDHLSNAPDIKFLECTVHSGKTLERISGENDRKSFALEVGKPA